MLKHLISLNLLVVLGISVSTVFPASVAAKDSGHSNTQSVYVANDNPMGQVDQVLKKAKDENKLALIVLGAQWCHDSRGFAEKLETPKLRKIIDKRFQTVFIDVGYYNDLRSITQRFGQAHYYATPTVLVVDPQSESLINGETLQIWGMADSVPLSKYTEYFSEFDPDNVSVPETLGAAYKAQISMFEQFQSQRLMEAYQQLVPGMLAEDQNGQVTDEFLNQWKEVRGFRSQLQKDLQKLYQQARQRAPLPLALPTYDEFSWNNR